MAPTSGHPCPAPCDTQRRRSQKGSEAGRRTGQVSGAGPPRRTRSPSKGQGKNDRSGRLAHSADGRDGGLAT